MDKAVHNHAAISLNALRGPNELCRGLCHVGFGHSASVSAQNNLDQDTHPSKGPDRLLISQKGSEEGTINADTKGGPLVM